MTTVDQRVGEILVSEGVDLVCGYPTTPLIESAAVAGIRPVVCRQERVGVNIADGYARTTGGASFGVFFMQFGPGAENAYSGVATAYADSVPLLIMPMGYPSDRENIDRYFSSLRNYAPICKSVQRIRSAEETDGVMRRAVAALRMGRGGPVLVELPPDVAAAPTVSDEPWVPVRAVSPSPDANAVAEAVEMLATADHPIVVAGQGVLYSGATRQLVALAEAMNLPVATTLAGKSAFPERHRLSLGCGALAKPETVREHFEAADVVLAVGASMMTHGMTTVVPGGKRLIHVSLDPSDFHRDYPSAVPIQSDARKALDAMLGRWEDQLTSGAANGRTEDPSGSIAATRERWQREWEPALRSDAIPIDPYRVVDEICTSFPSETSIITHDSGSPRDQLTPFYPADEPHSYIGWGKSHALGTGLGLAIGAKLAAPQKYCVNLMGDAAFGMTGLDIETAVRHRIPIITIVNNNGTMAIETKHMQASHERYQTRDIGGDYASIARSLGAEALVVEDPGELRGAFERAKEHNDDGRSVLVDVRTSPIMTNFSLRAY